MNNCTNLIQNLAFDIINYCDNQCNNISCICNCIGDGDGYNYNTGYAFSTIMLSSLIFLSLCYICCFCCVPNKYKVYKNLLLNGTNSNDTIILINNDNGDSNNIVDCSGVDSGAGKYEYSYIQKGKPPSYDSINID